MCHRHLPGVWSKRVAADWHADPSVSDPHLCQAGGRLPTGPASRAATGCRLASRRTWVCLKVNRTMHRDGYAPICPCPSVCGYRLTRVTAYSWRGVSADCREHYYLAGAWPGKQPDANHLLCHTCTLSRSGHCHSLRCDIRASHTARKFCGTAGRLQTVRPCGAVAFSASLDGRGGGVLASERRPGRGLLSRHGCDAPRGNDAMRVVADCQKREVRTAIRLGVCL